MKLLQFYNLILFICADSLTSVENRRNPDENKDIESTTEISSNHPFDIGVDYPAYEYIPKTRFSCKGKLNWHYYADTDTDCQVFHICETQHSKISFLCPLGSIFNQRHLICDWWYNFNCYEAENLYELESNGYKDPTLIFNNIIEDEIRDQTDGGGGGGGGGFDLSLASSGGNSNPKDQRKGNRTDEDGGRRNPVRKN